MFAGPNGAGKSTIKSLLRPELIALYINPDEIEKEMCERGCLDLRQFPIEASPTDLIRFLRDSSLLQKVGQSSCVDNLSYEEGVLQLGDGVANSYVASVLADYIRRKLIERRTSFTFETVMSSPDKVALLEYARSLGYRTYLYFIATEDPIINIARVRNRTRLGGHAVPEDKIVTRHARSLNLLVDAIRNTDRAFIFDNSDSSPVLIAEITEGRILDPRTDRLPEWFEKAVLAKLPSRTDSV
jgi:predicted ABC-type ATPase